MGAQDRHFGLDVECVGLANKTRIRATRSLDGSIEGTSVTHAWADVHMTKVDGVWTVDDVPLTASDLAAYKRMARVAYELSDLDDSVVFPVVTAILAGWVGGELAMHIGETYVGSMSSEADRATAAAALLAELRAFHTAVAS